DALGRVGGYKLTFASGPDVVSSEVELMPRASVARAYLAGRRAFARATGYRVAVGGHSEEAVELDFRRGVVVGSVLLDQVGAHGAGPRAAGFARKRRARVDAVSAGSVKPVPPAVSPPPSTGAPASAIASMCLEPEDLTPGAEVEQSGAVDAPGSL